MSFVPVASMKKIERMGHGDTARKRLPPWFKVKPQIGPHYQNIRTLVNRHGLHTICDEARCPNIWECWNSGTATFMILGDICTRRCRYCAVETGKPAVVDLNEPVRVADAVQSLNLRHAVITSVNRDDLDDGGASLFAATIREIRARVPSCTVEVLIPDFQGSDSALAVVMEAKPNILNHNVETVPRLFPSIRPQGKYARSLELLGRAKHMNGMTKSGLIVGMGETFEEICSVMEDLRSVNCDILSIGQYLQPTKEHVVVDRYYMPEEFDELKTYGKTLGFHHVESGPLVRSSYHAEQQAMSEYQCGT